MHSLSKANPCAAAPRCQRFPRLTRLKEFPSSGTLFCTRALWKCSNPMDFSWANASLFKAKVSVEMQLHPSSSALTHSTLGKGAPRKRSTLFSQLGHKRFVLRLEGRGLGSVFWDKARNEVMPHSDPHWAQWATGLSAPLGKRQ